MTCYVSSGTLNPTHSLTDQCWVVCAGWSMLGGLYLSGLLVSFCCGFGFQVKARYVYLVPMVVGELHVYLLDMSNLFLNSVYHIVYKSVIYSSKMMIRNIGIDQNSWIFSNTSIFVDKTKTVTMVWIDVDNDWNSPIFVSIFCPHYKCMYLMRQPSSDQINDKIYDSHSGCCVI